MELIADEVAFLQSLVPLEGAHLAVFGAPHSLDTITLCRG